MYKGVRSGDFAGQKRAALLKINFFVKDAVLLFIYFDTCKAAE